MFSRIRLHLETSDSLIQRGGTGLFGWRICRFRVKQNTIGEDHLEGSGVYCL